MIAIRATNSGGSTSAVTVIQKEEIIIKIGDLASQMRDAAWRIDNLRERGFTIETVETKMDERQ